jgi:hypothetical protein
MATAIENATISSDLKADPDAIWTAEALPNATEKLSSAFKLGQTLGGVEVKVVANGGHTAVGDIDIVLKTSATSGGSYAEATGTYNIAATTVIADGQELARFILPREEVDKLYAKVSITSSGNDVAGLVDAYLVFVS